jgi:light-regulated signal transduction histidine kinase (bacteriophytochrome)
VKSYTQLLVRRFTDKDDADAKEFAEYVVSGVDRMYELVSGLQSYSEVNRMPARGPFRADAGKVLQETLRNIAFTIQESGARITFDPLPEVHLAPAPLGKIFQNLLANAMKYRKPDVEPVIHVSARRTGTEWEFSVKDNGIGVDPKYSEHIFGVFRRLHGRRVPGTGIGLAIVKKIVESAGGRVGVISSPGEGADFRFTLPAV